LTSHAALDILFSKGLTLFLLQVALGVRTEEENQSQLAKNLSSSRCKKKKKKERSHHYCVMFGVEIDAYVLYTFLLKQDDDDKMRKTMIDWLFIST
jgi:hypothetical protein